MPVQQTGGVEMDDRIEVQVQSDHIESLTRIRKPIIAIEELIWNALDADADTVEISLGFNSMGGLERVIVSDNGDGIPRSLCPQAFGNLGGSPKLKKRSTTRGRVLHGKLGLGRFRAFGVGRTVTWTSTYLQGEGALEYRIVGHRSTIQSFQLSEERTAKRSAKGVTVEISSIEENFRGLEETSLAADELSRRLALYLRKYPGIVVRYEGRTIDPGEMEAYEQSYPLAITLDNGKEYPAELTVIEWKYPTVRALHLCNEHGFTLDEKAPGIQAKGFHFTAYLKSSLVTELNENDAFGLNELHPPLKRLLDITKDALRTHFRKRESARSDDLIRQWQKDGIYPYTTLEPDPIREAGREVFNVCAIKVHEYLPGFENSDQKTKRLTFRLLREALEKNASTLQVILREVLALPQEQQDELVAMLERTKLSSLISAGSVVLNRLDFLASLDPLLFGDFKKLLLERQHLQRILTDELWIFGEQYTLGVDDQGLRTLLEKHVEILERDVLAYDLTSVTDLNGSDRRLDMMLYQRHPSNVGDTYEHLVIELKRPSIKLGQKEINQIETYAYAIEADERFDKEHVKWTFILVGTELDEFAKRKCDVKDREFGHIFSGHVNIYVKRWASVIQQAKWRYEFFRSQLSYDATVDDGIKFLHRKHKDRLPE